MKQLPSYKKIVSQKMIVCLSFVLVANSIAYYGVRIFGTHLNYKDYSIPLDSLIPFLPWTSSIYVGCYAFWVVNYVIATRQSPKEAYKFFCADFVSKFICMAFFIIMPATLTRPEVTGDGFWDFLTKLVYNSDLPTNLFPSIHCSTSWFCFIAVRKNPKIKTWYKAFSFVFAIFVFVSTVTLKQHVFIDILGGWLLAECVYQVCSKTNLYKVYGKFTLSVYLSIMEVKDE